MQSAWHVCILVPAHDEEKLLPRCLSSLLRAINYLPAHYSTDIVLAVDASKDNSLQIGNAFLKKHGITIEIDEQQVGNARHLATEVALARYQGPLDKCWLANTDADCEVPSDWLFRQLQAADKGIQAIAGIIDVDNFDEHDDGVRQRFKDTYLINADGTHPHIHGANLGMRADIYLKTGGWPKINTAEDHGIWNKMKELQYNMTSDASLCVITSGRRMGRAPDGFAKALAAHNRNRYE